MKFLAGTVILVALGGRFRLGRCRRRESHLRRQVQNVPRRGRKGTPGMVKAMGVKSIIGASEATVKNAVTKGKNKMEPVAGVTGKTLDDVADCKSLAGRGKAVRQESSRNPGCRA